MAAPVHDPAEAPRPPLPLISRRRRHWHVDHTGACVACRVPGRATVVVWRAAHGDGVDVARWGYGCGRRDDDCRRFRLARGDHGTANDCPSHEAGSRVAAVPVAAVIATATAVVGVALYIGYGGLPGGLRGLGAGLHPRCRGLPGSLVLARCILALGLVLARGILSLALGTLPALLSRRLRSAGLALLPARCSLLLSAATALPATRGKSPALGAAASGEAAASAASPTP